MSLTINLLQFIAFLDLMAVGLMMPQLAVHARTLGASHITIGLLGSVYAASQLASGPLLGSLSDIKGRKNILKISLIICAIAYTVTGFVTSIYAILFLRAILGIFKQTQILTRAMVPDYEKSKERHSNIYGQMAAISGIGITLGPFIGGHVMEDYPEEGFKYISLAVGACFLLNAVLVTYLPYVAPSTKKNPRNKHEKPKKEKSASVSVWRQTSDGIKQAAKQLLQVDWPTYWDVFLLKALIGFAMGCYYSNYTLYLKSVFGLSPKYTGYIISYQGIIGSLSSFFIGYINSLYGEDLKYFDYSLRNLHVFILISTALVGMIFSFNIYLYVFWLIPLAVGNAIGRLVTLEMILHRSGGRYQATLIGASNSVRSLAGIIAPITAGIIGQYFGVTYVIYASFLSSFTGLCISCYSRNRKLKED